MQYSSSGVRQQTAELSSSFLGDSDMAQHFERDNRHDLHISLASERRHDPIEERSEPVTPNESPGHSGPLEVGAESQPISSYPESHSQSTPKAQKGHQSVPEVVVTDEDMDVEERTPLLPRARLSVPRKPRFDQGELEGQPTVSRSESPLWSRMNRILPSTSPAKQAIRTLTTPKSWDVHQVYRQGIVRPVSMLPSVFLGLLLNLLDALSYGIILFPLGEEVFSEMGADGVSMFYVSCIVSQLVYSTGSIFRGGVGSEMIEVVRYDTSMLKCLRR